MHFIHKTIHALHDECVKTIQVMHGECVKTIHALHDKCVTYLNFIPIHNCNDMRDYDTQK